MASDRARDNVGRATESRRLRLSVTRLNYLTAALNEVASFVFVSTGANWLVQQVPSLLWSCTTTFGFCDRYAIQNGPGSVRFAPPVENLTLVLPASPGLIDASFTPSDVPVLSV